MEKKTRRLVECDQCGVRYAFTVPQKDGAYMIACPRCHREIKFKVVNRK